MYKNQYNDVKPVKLKYYTSVHLVKNKIFVRGIDEQGNRTSYYDEFQPTVWVPYEFDYREYKGDIVNVDFKRWTCLIDDQPLVGLTFKNIYTCKEFVRKNSKITKNPNGQGVSIDTKVHTSPNNMFVSQYIAEKFAGDCQVDSKRLKIYTYDIETEIGHREVEDDTIVHFVHKNDTLKSNIESQPINQFEKRWNKEDYLLQDPYNESNWIPLKQHPYRYVGGFPDPMQAKEKVTLITVKDLNASQIWTWGMEDFVNDRDDVTYIQCKDEKTLLKSFVEFIEQDYPDAMTGWNCLNKNSTVWMRDRIGVLKDIRPDDVLVDSNVVRVSDVTTKPEYKITTTQHNSISCSKDHIFPCYVLDKNRYTNFSDRYIDPIDLTVGDMIHNRNVGREVFMLIPKHQNTNKDLTYRDVIMSDLRYYFDNYTFFENNCVIDNFEYFCNIIANKDSVSCSTSNIGAYKFAIPLNNIIDGDFCHLLGLIYTDGSYDQKRNAFSFYSSHLDLIRKVDEIIYPHTHNPRVHWSNRKHTPIKNNYTTKFSFNNLFGVLHSFILNESKKKKLNLQLLSQMSSTQFHAFLSGLIDGDGWVSKNNNGTHHYTTSIGWCNYNGDVDTLYELMLWNGYCCGKNAREGDDVSNGLSVKTMHNQELKTKLNLWLTHKQETLMKSRDGIHKNCKSRAFETNFKTTTIDGQDFFIVRVNNIEHTGKEVEMIDIETTNHYFYTQGIKTHNCSAFDNTYIANRVKNVLGEDWMRRLSPCGEINFKQVEFNEYGRSIVETSWVGINDLDYLRLYKKFTYGQKPSYKLDAIAEFEIGIKKIQNPTGGMFKDFYTGEFDVTTKPNDDDHQIKKLGYLRTQLKKTLYDHPENMDKYNRLNEKIIQMCKQLFIEYNIRDVELVDKIDAKQKFIDLIMTIAYMAHCNCENVFSPVQMWDWFLYNTLLEQNKVIPIKQGSQKSEKFPGAYVKPPLVGKHEFCESSMSGDITQ